MTDLSPSGGREGYGICDDAVDMGDNAEITNILLLHTVTSYFPRAAICFWTRSPVVWTT